MSTSPKPSTAAFVAVGLAFVFAVLIVKRPLYSNASTTSSNAAWQLNKGLVANGNSVALVEKGAGSSKFGALYLGQGSHLVSPEFTVRVDEGAQVWIGWVRPSKFAEGWGTKALMFGGNLADGSALLRGEFGPRAKQGDLISTKTQVSTDGVLRVSFAVNGVDLGTAFEITDSASAGEFFPLISFTDTLAKVTIVDHNTAPPLPPPAETNRKVGSWESVQTPQPVQLKIEKGQVNGNSVELKLYFKVGNSIRTSVVLEGDLLKEKRMQTSTRMMPPPEVYKVEQQVNALLEDLVSIREVDGEPFFLEFKSSSGDLLYFQHAQPAQIKPVTREELDRVLS